MRYSIFTLLMVLGWVCIAQSKKEQIEILTSRVDSLKLVINTERTDNSQHVEQLNGRISQLEENVRGLEIKLKEKDSEIETNKKQIEELRGLINVKSDSIRVLKAEVFSPKFRIEEFTENIDGIDNLFWQITLLLSDKTFNVSMPWENKPVKKNESEIWISNEVWDRVFYLTQPEDNKVVVKLNFHLSGEEEAEVEMVSTYVNLGNDGWILQSCDGLCSEEFLTFEQLYPVLKKSLLEMICEENRPYRIEEESNSLIVYQKESDGFLSSWEWNLKDQPLMVKDIDSDGLIDYTIELLNAGGGCGGQMGESERWTLFGSKPERFIWTHTIPYRSESGKWEKN